MLEPSAAAPHAPELAGRLEDEDVWVRYKAACAFQNLGPELCAPHAAALANVLASRQDELDVGSRKAAALCLESLAEHAPETADPHSAVLLEAWGPDKFRVSAYWPHGLLLCLSCHCVGWVFPLNSGEPKCVGAKKLIREPPKIGHIHPSKWTNVV